MTPKTQDLAGLGSNSGFSALLQTRIAIYLNPCTLDAAGWTEQPALRLCFHSKTFLCYHTPAYVNEQNDLSGLFGVRPHTVLSP